MRRATRGIGLVMAGALTLALAGCDDDHHLVVRDLQPPAAPQAVYSVTGDGEATLYWVPNTESDLAGYRVYRGPAYAGPYVALGHTTSTTWVDDTAVNGETYWYAVAAYDEAGNESELSIENVHDTPRPAGFDLALFNAQSDPAALSGWDFSAFTQRTAADSQTDIYFTTQNGQLVMVAKPMGTLIQDAGFHELDDLDWAPAVSEGWSPTGSVELAVGHAYYVRTRDSHYAKFRVTSLTSTRVVVDWAYQIDPDNPELKPVPGGTRTTAWVPRGTRTTAWVPRSYAWAPRVSRGEPVSSEASG